MGILTNIFLTLDHVDISQGSCYNGMHIFCTRNARGVLLVLFRPAIAVPQRLSGDTL